MNTAHLIWIIPISVCIGIAAGARYMWKRIPPICEDCPRTKIADPIGEKYRTEDES